MKIKYNNYIPLKGYIGCYILGVLFVRNEYKGKLDTFILNHEKIHDKQAKQLLFIFFYIFYAIEYIIRLFQYKLDHHLAYRNISFEREAYKYMYDLSYVDNMEFLSFTKHLVKK